VSERPELIVLSRDRRNLPSSLSTDPASLAERVSLTHFEVSSFRSLWPYGVRVVDGRLSRIENHSTTIRP
jgi:hypothetical protein